MINDCHCVELTSETMRKATELVDRYAFQLFDAILIAGAMHAGCSIFYSEDMQDGLVVEDCLTIVNPFVSTGLKA